jgi:hypothetical protein
LESQPLPSGGTGARVATLRIRARYPSIGSRVVEHPTDVVEHLPDVDPEADELGAGRLDVGHDELQTLNRARLGRRDPLPMMIEDSEPGGVNCTTRKSSPAPVRARRIVSLAERIAEHGSTWTSITVPGTSSTNPTSSEPTLGRSPRGHGQDAAQARATHARHIHSATIGLETAQRDQSVPIGCGWAEEPGSAGDRGRFETVRHAELAQDVGYVDARRLSADVERLADSAVRPSLGDETQHLRFAIRQVEAVPSSSGLAGWPCRTDGPGAERSGLPVRGRRRVGEVCAVRAGADGAVEMGSEGRMVLTDSCYCLADGAGDAGASALGC